MSPEGTPLVSKARTGIPQQGMQFYLGTGEVSWLGKTKAPLFISAVRLRKQKTYPKAVCRWALDSGGFSELSLRGRWTVDPETYVAEVRKWSAEIGRPDWVAVQDWMCEPIIRQKTGLSIAEHQARTIVSTLRLRELAPEIDWAPVVQGWDTADYLSHVAQYKAAGIDLTKEKIVGVGSVCRRQGTKEGRDIIAKLAALGLKLHAFGVKTQGLIAYGDLLTSADSMAWSFAARMGGIRLPGHTHRSCHNCLEFALAWRAKFRSA